MGGIAAGIAIGALSSGIGALAAGLAFSAVLNTALVGGAFGALSFLLNKPPDAPRRLAGSDHAISTVREAQPSREWVLGQRRIGGKIIYMSNRSDESGEPNNEGWLDLVIVLANHPIESVEDVYINGEKIYINRSSGEVLDNDDLPDSADNEDQRALQDRYRGNAYFEFRLDGTSIPFESLGNVAGSDWNPVSPTDTSTSGDKGTGLALVYFRGKWDRQVYPNGEPTLSFVVKGANDVYDPRTSTTGYTENAALLAAYALENIYNIQRSRINTNRLILSANICDQSVNTYTPDGGDATEKRYELSAVISASDNVQQVLEEMATSMAGSIFHAPFGGWFINTGFASTPRATWNSDDIVGDSIQVRPKLPLDERFNTIRARHIDTQNDWDFIDTKEVTNDGYRSEDGETLITNIDFPYVTSVGQSVRLQQQYLRRQRAENEITLSLHDPDLIVDYRQWDVVLIDLPRFGLSSARFRIVSINDQNSNDTLSFQIVLKADDPDAYDYVPNFQNLQLASFRQSTLVDSGYVPLLTNLEILSGENELKVSQDGTVQSRMLVRWTDLESPYVFDTQVEFRPSPNDPFQVLYTGASELYIPHVEDGVEYTVRAAHRNTLGVVGVKQTLQHTVIGKSALPDTPISVSFRQVGNQIRADIEGVFSRDLASVIFRGYYLRFGGGNTIGSLPRVQSVNDWSNAHLYGQIVSSARNEEGQLTYYIQLSEPGYYILGVRTVDTSGNLSEGVVSDSFTFVNLIQSDNLFEADYAPDWQLGTRNQLEIVDDALFPRGFNPAGTETTEGWTYSTAGRVFKGEVNSSTSTYPIEYNGFNVLNETTRAASERGTDIGFFGLNKATPIIVSSTTRNYTIVDLYTANDVIHCTINRADGNTVTQTDQNRLLSNNVFILINKDRTSESLRRSEILKFGDAAASRSGSILTLLWVQKPTASQIFKDSESGNANISLFSVQKRHSELPSFTTNEVSFDRTQRVVIHWAISLDPLPFQIAYPDNLLERLPFDKDSEYQIDAQFKTSSSDSNFQTISRSDPPTLDINGDEIIEIPAAQVVRLVLKLRYETTPTICRSFYVRMDQGA